MQHFHVMRPARAVFCFAIVALCGGCAGRSSSPTTAAATSIAGTTPPGLDLSRAPVLLRATGTVGGEYALDAHGAPCAGLASRAPSLEVEIPENAPRLSVAVTGEFDTTLMVEDARGNRFCNDDVESMSGSSQIWETFAPGMLRIWVGTFRPGRVGASFVLRISTSDDLRETLAEDAPELPAWAQSPQPPAPETPPAPDSTPSPDEIRTNVVGAHPRVRECYERFAAERDRAVRVVVKFVIESDGRVRAAATSSSTLGDVDTERCIAGVVRTLTFTPPSSGLLIIHFPFRFDVAPPDDAP